MPQDSSADKPVVLIEYAAPPLEKPKPKFRLGWISGLTVIVALIVECVYQLPLAQERPEIASSNIFAYEFGKLLAEIGLPLLGTWIMWRLFRRANGIAPTIFCVLVLFFAAAQVFDAHQYARKRANAALSAAYAMTVKDGHATASAVNYYVSLNPSAGPMHDPSVLGNHVRAAHAVVEAASQELDRARHVQQTLSDQLSAARLSKNDRDSDVQQFMARYYPPARVNMVADIKTLYQAIESVLTFLQIYPDDWIGQEQVGKVKWKTAEQASEFQKRLFAVDQAVAVLKRDSATPTPATRPTLR